MTDSNDKPAPGSVEPTTATDKPAARTVSIPRPSEVHPLNALSSTPPPMDVNSEETPNAWLVDDDLLDDEPTHTQGRLSSNPETASSKPAPLGVRSRFSTAPPQSLASRGAAPASPASETARPPSSVLPSTGVTGSAPTGSAPPGSRPEPSQPVSSSAPSSPRLTPAIRASIPAASSSRSPLAPRRLSTSILAKTGLSRAPAPSLVIGSPASQPPTEEQPPLDCPSARKLAQAQQTDKWLTRAAAFESHAATLKDAAKKARLLVVASEIYAMAGYVSLSRAAAERAGKLGSHQAHRQARQLAQVAGDHKATAVHFGLEANTAPTPLTRRHCLWANLEFERWVRKDALSASRLLDQVSRVAPHDPLPHLMKLARALGQNTAAPAFNWPVEVTDTPLLAAYEAVRRLRGAPSSPDQETGGVPAFLEVQRALERRDRVAAASALAELRSEPSLGRAAAWLAAALLAPTGATRRRAVEILGELEADRSSKAARRALLARALELGDNDAVLNALRSDATKETGERAFTSLDQLVLGVLCQNADGEPPHPPVVAEMEGVHQPLRAAAALRRGRPDVAGAIGEWSAPLVALTHHLGMAQDLGAVKREGENHALFRLFPLGQSLAGEATLPAPDDVLAVGDLFTEDHAGVFAFTAGALAETLGDLKRAHQLLEVASRDPLCGEAALRSAVNAADGETASKLFEEFAARVDDPDRKAEALVQAALASPDPEQQERLAALAHAAAPDHVLVEATVLRLVTTVPASTSETTDNSPTSAPEAAPTATLLHSKRLAILSHQSISGDNDYLRALALLRHVLNKPSSNTRPTLLSHAWDLWPKDLALLELRERVSTLPLDIRAKARETLTASVLGVRTRATLKVEAALLYELDGLPSAAARVAQPEITRPSLLDGCFGRNAPGTEFATSWRHIVLERAQGTDDAVERSHHWLQAARLASDAGDWAAERDAVGRAVQLDPQNVEGLLTAEALAFKDGEIERVAEVERLLSEALRSPDHLAHAQLASRFLQLSAGGTSGYPSLHVCVDEDRTPLEVARRLAYLAPRVGEDELGYRMFTQLLGAAPRSGDKVLLLMRCAELAVRLGRSGSALTHLEDALALQPDNLTALSLRAEILSDEYPAAAAEAYERLAGAAHSSILRASAYKRAAEQLSLEAPLTLSGGDEETQPRLPADANRIRLNLERALEAAPSDEGVLDMLIGKYVQLRLDSELGDLFVRQLQNASPETQQRLMLRWSEACAAMGSSDRAFELVREVLKKHPENPRALEQLATLTPDASEREQALLQLVRVSPHPAQQAAAYRQLGEFYASSSPAQRGRAVKCHAEAWRRAPGDLECFRSLVDAHIQANDLTGAKTTVDAFEQRARGEAELRAVTIARAAVDGARDPALGEGKLEGLLDERPFDTTVLIELGQLYLRQGAAEKLSALNARTRAQAERELPNGPHVAQYLSGLSTLAKLLGDNSASALTTALGNLYHQASSGLDPRGSRAISRALDAQLAPLPLTDSLRSLLARTCDALEEAFPLNVADLEPTPLSDARLRASFEMKAKAVGLSAPELFLVAGTPYLCHVAHRSNRVLLGSGWVQSAPAALQDFAVWRSLKLLQARVGAVAGLSAEATALRLDALLSAYADPKGRLTERAEESQGHRSVLHPLLPKDPALGPLAEASIQAIAQSSLEVNDAIDLWVDRCVILATGEPRFALHARCLMAGTDPSATAGGLMQAIEQHPAARRLLASLVNAEFVEAHRNIH